MIKGSSSQEDITILNTSAPNNRASKYESKTDRTKRKNKQIHYYIWRLRHPVCQ